MSTVTVHELAQIEAANASGRTPVVFVHGLWLLAASWDRWRERFAAAGYAPVALDWPGDATDVDSARAGHHELAGVGVGEVADHAADAIAELDRKPVLVGHSFGGLLVQILAGRGLGQATASIDPGPSQGVLPLPLSTLKSSAPVLLNPANFRRTVMLTFEQFRYGFANAVPETEARELYDTFHVPGPGRPLFQAATANVNPFAATKVDKKNPERGPLLIVTGEDDHIAPTALAKAAYSLQSKNQGITRLVEIPDAGHSLVIDRRWNEVADVVLDFFAEVGIE